jgi:glycosyltransferase involved in cell wall biosynthesis
MKVNVSVVGRFHAFDLAKELQKHNVLNRLITTYPKAITARWGVDKSLIKSEIFLELLRRYGNKIPFFSNVFLNSFVKKQHAKNSMKDLKECDIFIGWSGSSLEALIEAKRQEKITILERGSSHYTYQMKILQEENIEYGDGSFQPDYSTWQRELLEYELADYISIPSSYVKRSFLEYGVPEEKLLVNPYGVDLKMFQQILKKDDVFRIIYAGGGTLRKGYHYLLQAFCELDLPNCELWHLGSMNDEMNPFLEKYIHKNWIHKGHIPQKELYSYYSQGDMFIMCSIEEGMAMVQFQAMACGLPLICTTNTGGEDLISQDGEEGFVIPIRDVDTIKEKILFMYNNQDIAKEMGKKAKAKVTSGFSWDDYGDRYVENLKRIMK